MRSLPRNWRDTPRGDFECLCEICGVAWQRSRLTRKADGLLWCADCGVGCRDAVTLSRLNAAAKRSVYQRRPDGGNIDPRSYEPIEPFGVFDDSFDGSFA